MLTDISFLFELGIVLGSALVLSLVAWAVRVPATLGQLVAGIIIGPYGFKLLTNLTTIEGMVEIGIVLILFIIGLELDPSVLMPMRAKAIVFSFTEITISFVAGVLAGFLLGWPVQESILLAWVIAISGTALVAKILYIRGASMESSARIMMSALIIEDIIAVMILSLLPGLAAGSFVLWSETAAWVMRGVLLIALTFVLGVYVAPRVIDRISRFDLDEAGFLLSIGLGVAVAILSSVLGFSAATGAFLIGLAIRGEQAEFVRRKIRPIRDLFLVIFFVSMGMLIDPLQFLEVGVVLPVIGLAFIGKYFGSYLGAIMSAERQGANDVAIGMTPRGEFSLIIAREAFSAGAARALIYPIAGTVVMATSLVSALAQTLKKRL